MSRSTIPLTLLAAQFTALLNESNAFATQMAALLSVLGKDTALVDQLLAEADLQTWASTIPAVTGATPIMWDFGVGYGPIAPLSLTGIWTDPATSATYPNNPTLASNLATVLLPGLTATASGLTCPQNIATVPVNNLTWTYTTGNAQVEVLNQDSWTKLTLLEPQPLINFSSTPSVTPAASPFVVTGTSNLGSLPVYIQTSFVGTAKAHHRFGHQRNDDLSVSLHGGHRRSLSSSSDMAPPSSSCFPRPPITRWISMATSHPSHSPRPPQQSTSSLRKSSRRTSARSTRSTGRLCSCWTRPGRTRTSHFVPTDRLEYGQQRAIQPCRHRRAWNADRDVHRDRVCGADTDLPSGSIEPGLSEHGRSHGDA